MGVFYLHILHIITQFEGEAADTIRNNYVSEGAGGPLTLNASLLSHEPLTPPSWWSSGDTLLIEQRVYSNICAMSAGETCSPLSTETSNSCSCYSAGKYGLWSRLHTAGPLSGTHSPTYGFVSAAVKTVVIL